MFYERDTEALWNQFTPQVQSSMKSKEGLDDFRQTFEGRMGTETQLFDERVLRRSLLEIYVRPATFEYSGTRQAMLIGFDEPGKIDLFAIDVLEPPREAPSSHLEYVPRTPLRLPFDGAWYVLWGGRTIVQNRHAAVRDQRFAYDFIVVQDDKSYRTNGHENADYLCFGQPVLAPGAGTIVTVVDGIEDNVPRAMNAGSLGSGILGNHVVIAHGPNEFSFLAHFKNGSTRVQVGAQVEAGDPIGLCGNSGSSTEPHLHYHLQNTAAYAHGDGLPAHFRNYTSNGRFVESGEPIREERIVNGRN
jgi:murein DD-endopeptidase MepM/ murein hydrolase activator NlpD